MDQYRNLKSYDLEKENDRTWGLNLMDCKIQLSRAPELKEAQSFVLQKNLSFFKFEGSVLQHIFNKSLELDLPLYISMPPELF